MSKTTLVRFCGAALVTALFGSAVMTLLLFTPAMEWVGANSSALDMFTLGGSESGLGFAFQCWRDIFLPTLLFVVAIWGPIYYALIRLRRVGTVSLLSAGAALCVIVGLAMFARLIPWDSEFGRGGDPAVGGALRLPNAEFGLHAAVLGAGLGMLMAGVFRCVAGRACGLEPVKLSPEKPERTI